MLELSRDLYEKGLKSLGSKLSWSTIQAVNNCYVSYFTNKFISKTIAYKPSASRFDTLKGRIIQSVLEKFINYRLYDKYTTEDERVEWMALHYSILFNVSIVPEDSYNTIKNNLNKYLEDQFARYEAQLSLDTDIFTYRDIQLGYLDKEEYQQLRDDPKALTDLGNISETFRNILHLFEREEIDLRKVKSEVMLISRIQGKQFIGFIDFLYNKNCETDYWDGNMNTLKPGYHILDGKLNAKDKDPGQLFLYGDMVHNIISYYDTISINDDAQFSFLDWTLGIKTKSLTTQDKEYKAYQDFINQGIALYNKCAEYLRNVTIAGETINVYKVLCDLPKPDNYKFKGCYFCPVRDNCYLEYKNQENIVLL